MARQKGDIDYSYSIELKKKQALDANQEVQNYADLFTFEPDYLYQSKAVNCLGQDDITKLGWWYLIDPNNYDKPSGWARANEPLPINRIVQVGTYIVDTVELEVTLNDDWGFNEDGVNYYPSETVVSITPPDTNYPRADLIVWNSISGYQVIEGLPSDDIVIPPTPEGYIQVRSEERRVGKECRL